MTQAIYFLPGTMCDQRLWSPLLEQLATRHDKRVDCHFLSIPQCSSIDEILQTLKEQLPDKPITLLGFSLGGYLASALAVKYPQSIERLLVLSNTPKALPEKEVKERARTVDWINKHGYNGIPKQRILNLLDDSAHKRSDIIKLIAEMDASLGKQVLLQQLSATTIRKNLLDKLSQLTCQQYFAVGDNDNLVNVAELAAWSKQNEQTHFTQFAHTGHMLPLEQPKRLAQWLLKLW